MGIKKRIFSDGNKKERAYASENKRNYIIMLESSTLWHDICIQ